jgi:hypothetical protein
MALLAAAAALSLGAPVARATAAPDSSQLPARLLAAHNAVRSQLGERPLAWDPVLAQGAASYAAQLALSNSFQHSNRRARLGIGENLWMGTRGAFSYEAMVGGWSSEARYFMPGQFPSVSRSGNWADVGHYTQMIWPTTTHVGCALASNARSDYLVCRYSPAGNIDGRQLPYATTAGGGSIGRAR